MTHFDAEYDSYPVWQAHKWAGLSVGSVTFHNAVGRWQAYISVYGKQRSLGYSKTYEEGVELLRSFKATFLKARMRLLEANPGAELALVRDASGGWRLIVADYF